MGVSKLSRKGRILAVEIDAWAQQMTVLHKRECLSRLCGGRAKIWWNVRHPQSSPEVSNATARDFVINRNHVCETLAQRLFDREIPWLPGERKAFNSRTPEEVCRMLGREYFGESADEETPADTVDPRDPFPEARKGMPQTTPGREADRQRKLAWKAEQAALREREQARAGERPGGFGSVVDALSGRG